MTTGRWSKNLVKDSLNKEAVKVKAEISAKAAEIIDATHPASGFHQPKSRSAFQIMKAATGKYCSNKNTTLNKLEDLHVQKKGSVLHYNVCLLLADSLCSTHSAKMLASFTHNKFSGGNIEQAVSFMRSVTSSESHGHSFCSSLNFFQ